MGRAIEAVLPNRLAGTGMPQVVCLRLVCLELLGHGSG